jgi:hypothetical protein
MLENEIENGLNKEQPVQEIETPEVPEELESPETPAAEVPEVPNEQPKVDSVPLHVVKELREKNRQRELDNARLEGELNAYKQKEVAQVAVQQKSPMQVAAEQQGIDTTQPGWEDDISMSGSLYKAQSAWDNNQVALKKRAESVMSVAETYPDYEQVCREGVDHLTIAERRIIDGRIDDYGLKAYELCKKALVRAGITKPIEDTAIPITPKPVVPKVQSTTKKVDEPRKPKMPEPPSQDDILSGVSPSVQRVMNL